MIPDDVLRVVDYAVLGVSGAHACKRPLSRHGSRVAACGVKSWLRRAA
jgi:hypothetical protein